jgi:hypothetical protein
VHDVTHWRRSYLRALREPRGADARASAEPLEAAMGAAGDGDWHERREGGDRRSGGERRLPAATAATRGH